MHARKSNKYSFVGKFTERWLSRTQQRRVQNTVKLLRWSLLRKWLTIFVKSCISWANCKEIFSPGWNFSFLNRDEICSRMLRDDNVKTRTTIICKSLIRLNRAEISPRFEQTHHKIFIPCKWVENNHIIELLKPARTENDTLRTFTPARKTNWWMSQQNSAKEDLNGIMKWRI